MASPAAGTEWTIVLALPKSTKTRDTTRRPRQQDMEQRGCKVGLNASGEKYMDFYVVKYSSYIYFLSRASAVAKETYGAP